MKATCKFSNLSQIPSAESIVKIKKYISLPDGELDIKAGKEYVVYGIEFRDNHPWLYICLDAYEEYPVAIAADFFEITDNRLSKHWKLCFQNIHNKQRTRLVFEEWALDSDFYEKLVDSEPMTIATFAKYRELIDRE